jgi:nicotinamidase/pyrazinamidase
MPQPQVEPHRHLDPRDARPARRAALIIVDVQPTFCEGGELPVVGGNQIASRAAAYLRDHHDEYAIVVTTQDWHVDPGSHFASDPDFVDTWPPHGLAGTPNAELHPELAAVVETLPAVVRTRKGAHQAAYSGFDGVDPDGHDLARVLSDADVASVDVCGIAESHCVKATALDAADLSYLTTVLSDLTVPVTEASGIKARAVMASAGVFTRSSDQRGM